MEWIELEEVVDDRLGAGAPGLRIWSPGRVNLIGDHIDYSGGSVLPMALNLGTRAVVRRRSDATVRGYSTNFPETGIQTADLGAMGFEPEHGWFSYALGVVATFAEHGFVLPSGFDIGVSGNIPVGSGLSSSASVELAAAVAVNEIGEFGLTATELARLCREAENNYVGVACGVMDQLAIAEGRAGSALLMNCETLAVDPVPFPERECTVVVANTKHPRSLSGSEYNDRRASVAAALEIVNRARAIESQPPLTQLTLATDQDLADSTDALLDAGVLPFARHTLTEQRRVIEAADALRRGDVALVGELMRQSHESLRDDFAVTGPHLDALAQAAWETPGVIGARMTGAGFGGCTVNLVALDAVESAIEQIGATYLAEMGLAAEFWVVEPAPGAGVVR